MVKNQSANAGEMGSIPDLEGSHIPQLQSLHSRAVSPQLEKAQAQQWRPSAAKTKYLINLY